jgi:hypothetical protein
LHGKGGDLKSAIGNVKKGVLQVKVGKVANGKGGFSGADGELKGKG